MGGSYLTCVSLIISSEKWGRKAPTSVLTRGCSETAQCHGTRSKPVGIAMGLPEDVWAREIRCQKDLCDHCRASREAYGGKWKGGVRLSSVLKTKTGGIMLPLTIPCPERRVYIGLCIDHLLRFENQ